MTGSSAARAVGARIVLRRGMILAETRVASTVELLAPAQTLRGGA